MCLHADFNSGVFPLLNMVSYHCFLQANIFFCSDTSSFKSGISCSECLLHIYWACYRFYCSPNMTCFEWLDKSWKQLTPLSNAPIKHLGCFPLPFISCQANISRPDRHNTGHYTGTQTGKVESDRTYVYVIALIFLLCVKFSIYNKFVYSVLLYMNIYRT